MIVFLVVVICIAIYVIYKLVEKNDDNKVLTSTFLYKEERNKLLQLIKFHKKEYDKHLSNENFNDAEMEKMSIENHKIRIDKLNGFISQNEEYLKEKGRI